ncbi:hypothetical protein AOLI_G00100800 [Acnodon oligacanthus]
MLTPLSSTNVITRSVIAFRVLVCGISNWNTSFTLSKALEPFTTSPTASPSEGHIVVQRSLLFTSSRRKGAALPGQGDLQTMHSYVSLKEVQDKNPSHFL